MAFFYPKLRTLLYTILSFGSGEKNTAGKTVSLGEEMQTSTEKGENTNFLFTPSSSGTYRFTFYEDKNTFMITQK